MYRQQYPDDPGMHNMPGSHPDSSTRTHYREEPSFAQRVKNNCIAIVVGLLMIFAATALLFWNEGRAVQMARSLDEGLSIVRSLTNPEIVFHDNNNKLVHLVAPLRTTKPLEDHLFKINLNAVKLRRNVEMYQWVEQSHRREYKEGDRVREETTYTYDPAWRQDLVRSDSFNSPYNHQNPTSMPYHKEEFLSNNVHLGGYVLSETLVDKVSNYKRLTLHHPPPVNHTQLYNNYYYMGQNPQYPQVGDVRVYFEYAGQSGQHMDGSVQHDVVSVIAKQYNEQLQVYETEAGDELELLYAGEYSAQSMLGREKANNAFLTWAIRFAGWLLMFVGFGCLTSIINTLVSWLPLVREAVGLGMVAINASLSISLSLTVIAAGWIRYRPWLGCALLAIAAVPFILSKIRGRQEARSQHARSYRNYYD